ncbi:MAG: Ig-like domain repeat protein, partial [Actinobacteria bacterium]|nr:Ig-like domain repeat protein [Actinomycetota bacterium]
DRTTNDGATASNTTVTSATANFTAADVGAYIEGGRYRTPTDGVTNSTTTVTSATANFTSADVGSDIEGGSIPLGATIVSVQSATSVTISLAATTTATAVKLIIQNSTYGGIPANATIVSVQTTTSVTISAAATATATGVHLAITSNGSCIYNSQFTADSASTTCTANDTGPATASTTFTNGLLATATDNNQNPTTTVAIANRPAKNLTISGYFKLGASDKESFTYIFNEQITNADGSLTVNAAHLKPTGQTAFGDVIFGQSVCGVKRSSTTSVVSSVNPSIAGGAVTFTATAAPAAGTGTPTGKVQFTDNGANVGVPVALSSGKAAKAITFLIPGSYAIKAVYLGSGRITSADGTTSSNTTVTSASGNFVASDVGATISGS